MATLHVFQTRVLLKMFLLELLKLLLLLLLLLLLFVPFGMCEDVRLQISGLSKPFVTRVKGTNIWTITSVDAYMGSQIKVK